jgi:hypothetical protein
MNRTVAIVLTIVTALACGLPSCFLLCMGVFALIGAQMPEVMAQNPSSPEEVMFGAGVLLCIGAVLLVVPILVGVLSFYFSKKEEPATIDTIDYIPPAL